MSIPQRCKIEMRRAGWKPCGWNSDGVIIMYSMEVIPGWKAVSVYLDTNADDYLWGWRIADVSDRIPMMNDPWSKTPGESAAECEETVRRLLAGALAQLAEGES